ncbi:hypothetical protein AB0M43_15355 [Longispora sp. NPDC051575]|uniref:hypothetical protein n=1 Tax=Longispora sp. NPDC051575 TaxID=3154943 RepID=UPI0034293AF1
MSNKPSPRGLLALVVVAVLAATASAAATRWYYTRAPAHTLDDPADRPPAYPRADLAGLVVPACPLAEPGPAPRPDASTHRLVEWGAVRVVRCVYEPGGARLSTMDVVEGGQTVFMVTVVRRLLTPAQADDVLGSDRGAVALLLFSPVRYLFQYSDGRVLEVATNNGGYYRGTAVRYGLPRGRDMAALGYPGQWACGLGGMAAAGLRACVVTDGRATVPGG